MEGERVTFKEVLRERNFSLLWSGQVISNFGDRFNYMAVMGLILFNWEGSALDAGFMFIFMTLPALLFGPIAGVVVDRYDKKRVMILCDIVRAAFVAMLPFVTSLFQVYAIIFLVSSVSRFFYPARSAIIPQLVSDRQLMVANSLSQSTYQVSAIAGYALGGALVGIVGPTAVFYLDTVSYMVSALLIWSIDHTEAVSATKDALSCATSSAMAKVKSEMAAGIRYSYSEKRILYLLVTFTLAVLFFGGINILWVILVRDVLGLGIEGMGALESLMGGGMLLGTLAVGVVGCRIHNKSMIIGGFLVTSITFLAIGLWANIYNVLVCVFVAGAGLSFVNVPAITLIQRITPSHMMGRVFSILGTLTDTASLISMGAIGILAKVISVETLLMWSAGLMILLTLCASLVRVNLDEKGEEPAFAPGVASEDAPVAAME